MSVVTLSGRCLLAAIAALFVTAASASAQTSTTWTEPGGRYSLDFAPLGWTELDPPLDDGPTTPLGIEHRGFQESGGMRTCFISERRQSAGRPVTQQQMNTITRQLGPAGIQRTMGVAPQESATFDIDGITVIRAVFTDRWRQQMRLFYLADGDGYRQIFINCGATPPVSAEESDNIEGVLQSLRFPGN